MQRTPLDIDCHVWKRRNRGRLKEIADALGYTQAFVSDVFHGRRKSYLGDVEDALRKAGAPGWKQ